MWATLKYFFINQLNNLQLNNILNTVLFISNQLRSETNNLLEKSFKTTLTHLFILYFS